MSELWSVRRVLTWTTQHFERRGVESPRLTAEVLLSHALGCERIRLYVDFDRPLSPGELLAFRGSIERRLEGEPTQYLTGRKEFYNRSFAVDPRVLVPRPETELLVEAALAALPRDVPGQVLDLCTGSGCIAVTLAAERPLAQLTAVELSAEACEVARDNAGRLEVADRVRVLEGDLFAPLPPAARFEVIVSNPPYVRSDEIPTLSREVRREPRLALDGGPDGLFVLRRIVDGAQRWLTPGGLLALEMAESQGEALFALLEAAGYREIRIVRDLERRERHALARAPAAS